MIYKTHSDLMDAMPIELEPEDFAAWVAGPEGQEIKRLFAAFNSKAPAGIVGVGLITYAEYQLALAQNTESKI